MIKGSDSRLISGRPVASAIRTHTTVSMAFSPRQLLNERHIPTRPNQVFRQPQTGELLFVGQKQLEDCPIRQAGQPNATRANVTPRVTNPGVGRMRVPRQSKSGNGLCAAQEMFGQFAWLIRRLPLSSRRLTTATARSILDTDCSEKNKFHGKWLPQSKWVTKQDPTRCPCLNWMS